MIKFGKNIYAIFPGDRLLFCGKDVSGRNGGAIIKIDDITSDTFTYSYVEIFGSWISSDFQERASLSQLKDWVGDFSDISALDPRTIVRLKREGWRL